MNQAVEGLIGSSKGFSIAPAGCGKTEVIVEVINELVTNGKHLVLTHTHAGVHSITKRAYKKDVPLECFDAFTIDGFCRDYVFAYPSLSGYDLRTFETINWPEVRKAFLHLIRNSSHFRELVKENWQGVIIDEYQDCGMDQHLVVEELAKLIPCRLLGDPLQALYDFEDTQPAVNWDTSVEPSFARVDFDAVPVRWQSTAPELGAWLLEKRQEIIERKQLRLSPTPGCVRVELSGNFQDLTRFCCRKHYAIPQEESVLVIHAQANQCHFLAAKTGARFRSIEELEMGDLVKFANDFDAATDLNRFALLKDFTKKTSMGMTTSVDDILTKIKDGRPHNTADYRSSAKIFDRLAELEAHFNLTNSLEVFQLFQGISGVKRFRRELWHVTRHALTFLYLGKHNSLKDSAQAAINQYRSAGRLEDHRTIGRIRLVKGLEFDHVIIADLHNFTDPREMYVALTRARKSLHIFSSTTAFDFVNFSPPMILEQDYSV